MGLAHSPRIVTNGLVFAYDSDNIKSYKGPAMQNMASDIVATGQSGTGIVFTASTESVFIPSIGQVTSPKITGYNNYSGVSSACCPQIYYYVAGNGNVSVSPSTTYTYAIVYKTTSGYTSPNFMYRYEFNGGTYVTEGGVHNDSNRIHLGDGWYWAWGTFTTSATTNLVALRCFYYKYGTTNDNIYIAKVLVTPGNFTGLHPSRWPDVNTTRANTATVYDISGQNISLTASSLTYAANGSFSFNGSGNYLDLGSSIQMVNNFTCSFWHRNLNGGYLLDQGNLGIDLTGCLEITNYGLIVGYNNIESVTADGWAVFNDDVVNGRTGWNNITVTFSSGVVNFYINGRLDSTKTMPTITSFTPGGSILKVGRRAFNTVNALSGQLSNVSIYNRVLTAAEVKQNYNALRGRFGL